MHTQLAHPANPGFATAPVVLSMSSLFARNDDNASPPNGPGLQFPPDSEIYGEGDENRSFYKVVSGVVRTCKFLSDGRRQIEAFHLAGDIFGFEMGAEYRHSAEAVSGCTVIAYRRRDLERLTATDTALAWQLFSYAMHCLERAQAHSQLLARRSAAEKLAAFLLELAERHQDGAMVELAMTRQDIGDYLGLTIETVSRTVSQFERDGVIALPATRRVRLKNLAALRALCS